MASAWAHGHGCVRCAAPLSQLPRHASQTAPAYFLAKKLWLFIYGLFIYLMLLVRYAVARGGLSPD